MWEYYRDKYGVLEALKQFPLEAQHPSVIALKAMADSAIAGIDTIMKEMIND